MQLPQLPIAARLYAIFAMLVAATLGLAAVAVVNTHRHTALTDEFESAYLGAMNVERVNALIYAALMESRGIYMSSDIPAARAYGDGLIEFNERIGQVVAQWRRTVGSDDAALFEAFVQRIRQFQDFCRELVHRGIEINPAAGREWADNDANRALRKALNDGLEGLAKLYAARARSIHVEIDRGIDRAAWLLSLLAVIAVLLAGAGALIIWRGVARPLARITAVTQAVAAGQSQDAVPCCERGDEVGALARSIAVFQGAIRRNRELSRTIVMDAQTRELRQDKISAQITRFGANIEATLAELRGISDKMCAAATQLGEAADSATQRTAGAASASAGASANVKDIAAAADQLSASVAEIDRQVAQSNAIAVKAVEEAKLTNASVKELNDAADRIGNVVRLITDIAEQTNLLALNATIEAARAGDAGRGFAIVASEVKALAGQTSKATDDIGAQISAMQHATSRSIEAIETIERTIRDVGEISSAIAAAITEQGAATQEIARNVETAAKRTIETASEVGRVGEATAATRRNATSVKSVADDLGQVASRIRGQVDQFFEELRAA